MCPSAWPRASLLGLLDLEFHWHMKCLSRVRTAAPLLMLLVASLWARGQSNSNIPAPYLQWLREDVGCIITDPEVSAFKMLKREERDNFIDAFWRRRDPTPETEENEFEGEHYRRIVYANERFSSFVPGWKTDRGRIYILFGPPDQIAEDATALTKNTDQRTAATVAPVEVWRYRYLQGFGQEVELRFVDDCNCGEFHLMGVPERDPNENNAVIDHLSRWPQTPQVRFKNLEEVVTSKVRYNLLPFSVRTNALRATHFTDWLSLTIQLQQKNLVANEDTEESWIHLQVFARITTPNGRIAETIEEEIRRPLEQDAASPENVQFSHFVPLRPGDYRLSVVVYDVNADRIGTFYEEISLPAFPKGQLEASPIIVGDAIDIATTPRERLARGYFDVGDTRIHLRFPKAGSLNPTFRRAEQPDLFIQAYGLASNPQDRKSHASIVWDLRRNDTGATVRRIQETNAELQQFGEEITLRKSIPLTDVKPGSYQLHVTVTDQVTHQSTVQSTPITVE